MHLVHKTNNLSQKLAKSLVQKLKIPQDNLDLIHHFPPLHVSMVQFSVKLTDNTQLKYEIKKSILKR